MKKIILDRRYGTPVLLSLIAHKKDTDLIIADYFPELISSVNTAAILYDRIILEDTLGTALGSLQNKSDIKFINQIFEIKNTDEIIINNNDQLLYEENVKSDLEDKELLRLVKKYQKEKRVKVEDNSQIYYINKLLLIAKSLNAHILPYPDRFELLKYKFNESKFLLEEPLRKNNIIKNIFSIQIPDFDINDYKSLLEIRNDKRLIRLRKLIDEMETKIDFNSDVNEQIKDELIDLQNEIITIFKPKKTKKIAGYLTSPLPFPLSLGVQAAFDIEDLSNLEKYGWYFLIQDLKNIS